MSPDTVQEHVWSWPFHLYSTVQKDQRWTQHIDGLSLAQQAAPQLLEGLRGLGGLDRWPPVQHRCQPSQGDTCTGLVPASTTLTPGREKEGLSPLHTFHVPLAKNFYLPKCCHARELIIPTSVADLRCYQLVAAQKLRLEEAVRQEKRPEVSSWNPCRVWGHCRGCPRGDTMGSWWEMSSVLPMAFALVRGSGWPCLFL